MHAFNNPIGEDYGQWQLTFFFNRKIEPSFHNDGFCYTLWKIAKNPSFLFRLMGLSKIKEVDVPFRYRDSS